MNTHERQLLEVLADDRMGDPAKSAAVRKLLVEFDEVVTALEFYDDRSELPDFEMDNGEMMPEWEKAQSALARAKGKPEVDREDN